MIQAGASDAAQALMGRTVAILGGAMYSEYRLMKVSQCLPMNEGVTAKEGASCFVNPLTALGMVETMRQEGHRPRPYGSRFEPWPDVGKDLPERQCAARQYRPKR